MGEVWRGRAFVFASLFDDRVSREGEGPSRVVALSVKGERRDPTRRVGVGADARAARRDLAP